MKKWKLSGLLMIFVFCISVSAYAYLEPTGPRTSSREGEKWLRENQTEVLLSNFLAGNYAFADGCTRAWAGDKYVEMSLPAVMNESKRSFSVPAEFAREYLGINRQGDYVSSEEIAAEKGMYSFFDPRGFCMLSNQADAVDTNDYGTDSYQDNYLVLSAIGDINWNPVFISEEDFKKLRNNWYNALIVPEDHPDAASLNKSIAKEADTYFASVALGEDKKGPFTDLQFGETDRSSSAGMSTMQTVSERLYNMARAYVAGGRTNEEQKKKILGVIRYSYDNQLSLDRSLFDKGTSWPAYQFVVPFYFGNTLCLMYDDISAEDMKKYTDALFDLVPEPTIKTGNQVGSIGIRNWMTGTNRMWSGTAFLNVAILAGDSYRAQYPLRFLNETLTEAYQYKCSYLKIPADGWYEDGSMVFHSSVAYNTSYGADFLRTCSSLLAITKDTVLDVRKTLYCWGQLYEIIEKNVVPFFVDGRPMKMTNGRHDPTQTTASVFSSCIYISYYADESVRNKLWQLMADEVITENDINSYGGSAGGGYATRGYVGWKAAEDFKSFCEKRKDAGQGKKRYNGVYNAMNKAVHQSDDFKASVSMSSTRIKKYENYSVSFADTSSRQWYINDGSVFVYTGDRLQFEKNYFVNMNPYYVPGTTVDSMTRVYESTEGNIRAQATNAWAGGVSDGEDGVVGMIMGNDNLSGLSGRKSYFMLGDRIVCMGTGITGGTGEVHTTVDNRLITKSGNIAQTEVFVTPVSVSFSEEGAALVPESLFDGDLTNGFATDKTGVYLEFDLGESCELSGAAIAWYNGTKRIEYFSIEASSDGKNFVPVYSGQSGGNTQKLQLFDFTAKGRYIRLYLMGSSLATSTWQFYSEIKFIKAGTSEEELARALSMPEAGYDEIVVDGEEIQVAFNQVNCFEPDYVHLDSNSGYVFMGDETVGIERGVSESSGQVFAIISVMHGENPSDSSYVYTMLPSATREETEGFANNPDVEILKKSNAVHAVKDLKTGIVYINFFSPGECMGIRALMPCALMLDSEGGRLFVSDPSKERKQIKLALPENLKLLPQENISEENGVYVFDISSDNSLIYGAELIGEKEHKNVRTINYKVETALQSVYMRLFAYGGSSDGVQYEVAEQPEYGEATVKGDMLYYTARQTEGRGKTDIIRVRALTGDGTEAEIRVEVILR
ncbi:MAG: discoidin domain-containing protein [Clostridia bacterium]|nr:discoidin domain-containing protein [Clostridia bacterium]